MIKKNILLFILLVIGAGFRLYGINWDNGHYFHPDERAIILNTLPLAIPSTYTEFFSKESPWNPNFFAYGSFPLYLLKLLSLALSTIDPLVKSYERIYLLGRLLSVFFELGTIIILYKLAKKLIPISGAFFSAGIYSLTVLPIQLAHFFAVDTILTFFTTATLLRLISYYEAPTLRNACIFSLLVGFAFTTKFSALTLFIPIAVTIGIIIYEKKRKFNYLYFLKLFSLIGIVFICTTFFLQPYMIIDFHNFSTQLTMQSLMTKNAFVFPYTLQYVFKIPFLYELQNIFFWGQGPVISFLSIIGIILFIKFKLFHSHKKQWGIVLTFFISYFFIISNFKIGFMRYLLPIYPILSLFAGITLFLLYKNTKSIRRKILLFLPLTMCSITWIVSFSAIYSKENTRITASNWISSHIPSNKILAIEHWDDQIPIQGFQQYSTITLPLYDTDSQEKWASLTNSLAQTDYIIIASDRLYVPLQKLTNCSVLPSDKCYRRTAQYYSDLFSGRLGFTKIAQFSSYPTIPFIQIKVIDDSSDESFHVYDHPKIMIFKKNEK